MDNLFDEIGFDARSPQKRRLDAEWVSVSALREIFGLVNKRQEPPSYSNSLVIGAELYPALFHRDRSLLARRQESAAVKLYRQMADKRSKLGENITPLGIVEEEISDHERMLDVDNGQDAEYIEDQLKRLRKIRRELVGERKKYEENDIILRDIHVGAELPISGRGENYREFELPDNRVMRIRLLHPGEADRITGADVIYEHYANDKKRVRIAAIQYKIWDGETLYITRKINNQLQRLQQTFCEHQCCQLQPDQNGIYRLPCCAAFLRPTDELQVADNKLVSSGYHIPVCRVKALWEETQRAGRKLTWKNFRSECITYRVFEELFNTDMLGSRWLETRELEALYRDHKVLEFDESLDDRLLIHVQSY